MLLFLKKQNPSMSNMTCCQKRRIPRSHQVTVRHYHPMMFSTFTAHLPFLGKPGAISPLRPIAIMAAA